MPESTTYPVLAGRRNHLASFFSCMRRSHHVNYGVVSVSFLFLSTSNRIDTNSDSRVSIFSLLAVAYSQLYQRKHKTGFKTSDLMIDRIIRGRLRIMIPESSTPNAETIVTVQTGLITSVVAVVDLIVYLTDVSASLYHFGSITSSYTLLLAHRNVSCNQVRWRQDSTLKSFSQSSDFQLPSL